MRYAVLLYQDEGMWARATAEEREGYHAAHIAFDEAVAASPATTVGGEALVGVANATTLRYDAEDRSTMTDGPFAETAEQLGGFYLLDAPDLDVVTALCAVLPHEYTIEVRPVASMSEAGDWLDVG